MDIYGGLLHCRNIKGPFYRRYSIVIEIRCIFRFCPRWMLVNWPLQNLVHGTTAVQSRHEQNWTLIDTQKWNHRTTNFPLTLNFMLMGGLSVFVFDLAFLWNHSETSKLVLSNFHKQNCWNCIPYGCVPFSLTCVSSDLHMKRKKVVTLLTKFSKPS